MLYLSVMEFNDLYSEAHFQEKSFHFILTFKVLEDYFFFFFLSRPWLYAVHE